MIAFLFFLHSFDPLINLIDWTLICQKASVICCVMVMGMFVLFKVTLFVVCVTGRFYFCCHCLLSPHCDISALSCSCIFTCFLYNWAFTDLITLLHVLCQFKRRVQESTQILRELEISLRTNYIGWVSLQLPLRKKITSSSSKLWKEKAN